MTRSTTTQARARWRERLACMLGALSLATLVPACLVDRSDLASGDTGVSPPDALGLDAPGLDAPPAPDAWGLDAPSPIDAFGPPVDAPPLVDAATPTDAGNDAGGIGDRDAGSMGVTFTRIQRQEAEGNNPTASFATVPRAGNLLVAIGFHREDEASPEMTGWDRRLYDYYRTGGSDRRCLVVFSRIAGDAEPTSVQLVWSPTRNARLLLQELEASAGGSWSFEQAGSSNSAGSSVTTLVASTSDTPDGDLLVLGAFGAREDSGDVTFSSLDDAITLRGTRTIASAFARLRGGDPVTTTATWPMGRLATVGIVAFRFAP